MKHSSKTSFPLDEVRRFLEPGPVVLVSSAWKGETNIMTLGWHMVMGLDPSLLGCYVSDANHSYDMLRKSRQCVINLPTADLLDTIVDIGNCSGAEADKFAAFGLTAVAAAQVDAPLIRECYANFECRLFDGSQVAKHGLFIWEVVAAHVATAPKLPQTVHYRGVGAFMVSGHTRSRRSRFKPGMLGVQAVWRGATLRCNFGLCLRGHRLKLCDTPWLRAESPPPGPGRRAGARIGDHLGMEIEDAEEEHVGCGRARRPDRGADVRARKEEAAHRRRPGHERGR